MLHVIRYVPNALTLSRIGLAVFVLIYILGDNFSLALVLFMLGLTTDFFDGAIARRYGVQTTLGGKFLEPAADATLVLLTGLGLSWQNGLPKIYYVVLGILIILYFAIVICTNKKRVLRFRQALEPTLDGVCIVCLGVWLALLAGRCWPLIIAIFFVTAALFKTARLRDHLLQWKKINQ